MSRPAHSRPTDRWLLLVLSAAWLMGSPVLLGRTSHASSPAPALTELSPGDLEVLRDLPLLEQLDLLEQWELFEEDPDPVAPPPAPSPLEEERGARNEERGTRSEEEQPQQAP